MSGISPDRRSFLAASPLQALSAWFQRGSRGLQTTAVDLRAWRAGSRAPDFRASAATID
jgi:hypothetical protein